MPCKHKLTSSTLTKVLTSLAQIHHCVFGLSSAVSYTETHSEQTGSGVPSGDCLFFKCRQLPMRAVLVFKAMVPCYTALCKSSWCPHIKLHGLSVHLFGCCSYAFSKRPADVTDMILLFRPGYFQKRLSFFIYFPLVFFSYSVFFLICCSKQW